MNKWTFSESFHKGIPFEIMVLKSNYVCLESRFKDCPGKYQFRKEISFPNTIVSQEANESGMFFKGHLSLIRSKKSTSNVCCLSLQMNSLTKGIFPFLEMVSGGDIFRGRRVLQNTTGDPFRRRAA